MTNEKNNANGDYNGQNETDYHNDNHQVNGR